MQILEYNDLDIKGLESKYQKLLVALTRDDFYASKLTQSFLDFNRRYRALRM